MLFRRTSPASIDIFIVAPPPSPTGESVLRKSEMYFEKLYVLLQNGRKHGVGMGVGGMVPPNKFPLNCEY